MRIAFSEKEDLAEEELERLSMEAEPSFMIQDDMDGFDLHADLNMILLFPPLLLFLGSA